MNVHPNREVVISTCGKRATHKQSIALEPEYFLCRYAINRHISARAYVIGTCVKALPLNHAA